MVLKLLPESEAPEGLLKYRLWSATSRDSDLVGVEWSPRICISNKFPGDAGGETTLKTTALEGFNSIQEARVGGGAGGT